MAKRLNFSFSTREKDIFNNALANNSKVKEYILKKGVIRAMDKGELYDHLREVYNMRSGKYIPNHGYRPQLIAIPIPSIVYPPHHK